MASNIVLFSGIFFIIILVFSGLMILSTNYSTMSKDIISSKSDEMGNYLKSNIVIGNITISPSDTIIYVYNNGSTTLTSAYVDLYINGKIIPRNDTAIKVVNSNDDEFWIEHYNITITYNKTLESGDNVMVVCETGKKSSVVI